MCYLVSQASSFFHFLQLELVYAFVEFLGGNVPARESTKSQRHTDRLMRCERAGATLVPLQALLRNLQLQFNEGYGARPIPGTDAGIWGIGPEVVVGMDGVDAMVREGKDGWLPQSQRTHESVTEFVRFADIYFGNDLLF